MILNMRRWGNGPCPDNGNVNVNSSNANFPNVGGNYNNGDDAGLFYANVNNNSTNSNTNYGSRNASISHSNRASVQTEGKSPQPCHSAKHEGNNTHVYTLVLPSRAKERVPYKMQVM